MTIAYGDKVRCDLSGAHSGYAGCGPTIGFVIGEASYSRGDVVVIASTSVIGMPVNKKWCVTLSSGHDVSAIERRYRGMYPKSLKEKK